MPKRNTLKNKTIGFIGAGKMGQGLMEGLIAHGVSSGRILISDPRISIRRSAARRGIRVSACNCDVACCADIIILAVKPQEIRAVLKEIGGLLVIGQIHMGK